MHLLLIFIELEYKFSFGGKVPCKIDSPKIDKNHYSYYAKVVYPANSNGQRVFI
jgi:hypothetical protein